MRCSMLLPLQAAEDARRVPFGGADVAGAVTTLSRCKADSLSPLRPRKPYSTTAEIESCKNAQ
jgi:hypothetical protein